MLSRAPVTHLSPATRFRSELGALLQLAIPVVLSELGWMAMSIVDTIMVGRLSPAAIGAVGISSAIFYTPALFGIGLLLGLDTLVAQAFGRGDFDDCHRALAQGVYLAIAYTPIAMLLVGFAPHLFPLLGITEAVRAPATEYIQLLKLQRPSPAHLRRFPALPAGRGQGKAGDVRLDLRQSGQLVRQLGAHLRQAGTSRNGRAWICALHLSWPASTWPACWSGGHGSTNAIADTRSLPTGLVCGRRNSAGCCSWGGRQLRNCSLR